MVNFPKTLKAFCQKCDTHKEHKVTQYKTRTVVLTENTRRTRTHGIPPPTMPRYHQINTSITSNASKSSSSSTPTRQSSYNPNFLISSSSISQRQQHTKMNSTITSSTNALPSSSSTNVYYTSSQNPVISQSATMPTSKSYPYVSHSTSSSATLKDNQRKSTTSSPAAIKVPSSPSKFSQQQQQHHYGRATSKEFNDYHLQHETTDSFLMNGGTLNTDDSTFGLLCDPTADDSFVYNSSYMSSGSSTPPEPFSTEMQRYVKEKILTQSSGGAPGESDSRKEDVGARDGYDNFMMNNFTSSSMKKKKDLSSSFNSTSFPIKSFSKI